MTKTIVRHALAFFIGAFVWEDGHPYIPGLVVDHDHTHECKN